MGEKFHFVGVVDSVNVKGIGPASSHQYLLSVLAADGSGHRTFRLDWSDPVRYAAMHGVVHAAYVSEALLYVNAHPADDKGPAIISELEIVRTK